MHFRILFLLLAASLPARAIDGKEILNRIDRNNGWKTMTSRASMEIMIDNEVRTKTMTITGMSDGNRSLVTFTNPGDEGTRYLMLGKDLWIYFPEENDVVKISGHMLKEGMMGSDVSYEDALEADQLTKKYDVVISGDTLIDSAECYVLTLTAVVKDAPYYRRVMCVDKKRFVPLTEESYAKSGKLLKTVRVLEIRKIGTLYYPVKIVMKNTLRKNSRTVFTSSDIVFDGPVDPQLFTMRNLRR